MPNEKYTFNFTEKEVKEFLKQVTDHKKGIIQQVCYAVIFLSLSFLALISNFISDFLPGLFLGALITYSAIMLLLYIQSKKTIKAGRTRIATNTYQYEFFDDYIFVTIIDSISQRTIQIKYSNITSVKSLKNHYVVEYANQNYFLRKSDLIENAKITIL